MAASNMTPFIKAIQLHLHERRAAQVLLDAALSDVADAKKHLAQDWIEVRRVLHATIPDEVPLKVGLTQDNMWVEEFIYTADDVVAYVHMQRIPYLWNDHAVPPVPLALTKDELKVVATIEEKILEMGFTMVHDMVTDGNITVWRLSMPT